MSQHDWTPFALLLVDLQEGFWSLEMAEQFPDFPASVMRLLSFCRDQGIEVIHLRAGFEADMSDWMVRYKLRGRIPCVRGTPGADVLPFAREQPGEAVIVKSSFDGFLNPELLAHLRQGKKRFLLTAGLITSVCVLLTTASAAQCGFLTAVVEDCCADDLQAHKYTLERYPFIFERTTVDGLPGHHARWMGELEHLASLEP